MAFPIPSHLPRQKDLDVSTTLLTKMSEVTSKALTYELASSWVTELDVAIRETRSRIHDRVQKDLPAFEQQVSTSRSIQERLHSLSSNVDTLATTLSHPETGMIPNLIKTLSQHAALTQEATDSDNVHRALAYLLQCRRDLEKLTALSDQGRLPEAVHACQELETVLDTMPEPLESSSIATDLRRRCRSVKDRTQEQLAEAYSRGISLSPHEIVIQSTIQVRKSEAILSLPAVISSLSASSLVEHLNILRRDLTTHYVDHILSQPFSAEISSEASYFRLTLFPSPPNAQDLTSRVDTLSTVLTFLVNHLLPQIPSDRLFSRTLCKPVTAGLLNKLLIPSLPSSLNQLPQYLSLLRRAVDFEEECISKLLGNESQERDVKSWADAIASHYERKRRMELLDRARSVILSDEDDSEQFRVEVLVTPDTPNEPEPSSEPVRIEGEPVSADEEGAWGFEEEDSSNPVEEDGWGFDDEPAPPEPEPPAAAAAPVFPEDVEDPSDAWGWNDEEQSPEDELEAEDSSAWDDPWGTEAAVPTQPPKAATRLERHVGKANGHISSSPLLSPNPVAAPPPTPAIPATAKQSAPVLQEFYLVSSRVKKLMFLVEDMLREAEDLSASSLLPSPSNSSAVGSVIGQAAAMVLDLYRALYPVRCADQLAKLPKRSMRFSNDCLWVGDEVGKLVSSLRTVISISARDRLLEGQERLKLLGKSWFQDSIDNQCQNVNEILDGAHGFTETGDQDRFDECEHAVNDVLQGIRRWSQQVKPELTKSKYYNAIGAVVEAALSRMLHDVLALPDIPEIESHKLSELCRILGALEALFVEDVDQPSFVVAYVPSWLKFSYLSELLEASIADISYLFEEGALVDFEIEELVKLVRALFADTPLRTNTVNRLMQGHPGQL